MRVEYFVHFIKKEPVFLYYFYEFFKYFENIFEFIFIFSHFMASNGIYV